LEFLSVHRNAIRTVDAAIDKGDAAAIQNLQKCMEKWISSQNSQTVENEDGSTTEIAGQNQINALDALRKGNMSTIKTASTLNKKYDLITWMIVS